MPLVWHWCHKSNNEDLIGAKFPTAVLARQIFQQILRVIHPGMKIIETVPCLCLILQSTLWFGCTRGLQTEADTAMLELAQIVDEVESVRAGFCGSCFMLGSSQG